MDFVAEQSDENLSFEVFQLPSRQIHAEGFKDWVKTTVGKIKMILRVSSIIPSDIKESIKAK
jgi:hypothetical protein